MRSGESVTGVLKLVPVKGSWRLETVQIECALLGPRWDERNFFMSGSDAMVVVLTGSTFLKCETQVAQVVQHMMQMAD
jgi:hypothetical protein